MMFVSVRCDFQVRAVNEFEEDADVDDVELMRCIPIPSCKTTQFEYRHSKVSTKNGYVGVFVLPLPSSFLLLLFSVSPKRLARKGVLGLVGPFEFVFVDEERSWLMIELSGRARPRTPEKPRERGSFSTADAAPGGL